MSNAGLCYKCSFRGEVEGSAHSSCQFFRFAAPDEPEVPILEIELATGMKEIKIDDQPAVEFDQVGIDKGWVNWPINFDPIWLTECKFFKAKTIL